MNNMHRQKICLDIGDKSLVYGLLNEEHKQNFELTLMGLWDQQNTPAAPPLQTGFLVQAAQQNNLTSNYTENLTSHFLLL